MCKGYNDFPIEWGDLKEDFVSENNFLHPYLPQIWLPLVRDFFNDNHWHLLNKFLSQEYQTELVYPPKELIFSALAPTHPLDIKVVILGQDPYHNENQAHGLAFSVLPEQKIPPSLKNIYKELNTDLGMTIPAHGFLEAWAQQGVLLLNTVLTVRAHQPASHQKQGWEQFTDYLIQKLSESNPHLVFVLWGNFAQKKKKLIDAKKHTLICGVHPSPLSAHRGFFNSKPFSKVNQALKNHQQKAINWELPPLEMLRDP